MELDDINLVKPSGDHETSFYDNSKITSATLETTESAQPDQTEKDEGLYAKLKLERKSNDRKTLTLLEEETIKRNKCFIYIILALVIALYIGIITLTIVVAVQKAQDGGWSNWETWSTCSDSCGGGIKLRNRSCSNPTPSSYGKQCMGNVEQVSLCNKQLCPETDGSWSNWENWSACTETCGGGIKLRNRSCLNPALSMLGKQCLDKYEQLSQCNKQLCPGTVFEDGGWSVWGDWGTCTESCGGGVRTRSRSCKNPTPSMSGRPCTGDYTDVSTCNKTTCPEHSVAFTAYDLHKNSSTYSALLFQNNYINIGNGYDTTTGIFTCNIPGVYYFVVTLVSRARSVWNTDAYLRINGSNKLYLRAAMGINMMTGAGTFHLNQNDIVDVYGISNFFYDSYYSYFTGFLITPD